jgi:phosphatidylglycerophosphate synthase/phosphatidylglycerophosphatase A
MPAAPPPSRAADPLRRRLPNALTIARLAISVLFFIVLALWRYDDSPLAHNRADWWLLLAAALFIIAAATDYLDGFLARRWSVTSTFGRIMDPFADKLLVIGGFIFLAGPGFAAWTGAHAPRWAALGEGATAPVSISAVEPWMVVLILARELLVTSVRATMESRGIDFSASTSGKLKMVLQSITVPGILILLNFPVPQEGSTDAAGWLIRLLVWATVIVTAWSGVPYIVRAITAARTLRRPAWHPGPPAQALSPTGELLITSFYLGRLRPFPGTWGSIPSVVLAGVLIMAGAGPAQAAWLYNIIMLAVAAGFMLVCAIWADAAEARFLRKDPANIVADETSGQAMALLFLPAAAVATPGLAALTLVIAFVTFRVMDTLKPYPAYRIQRLPGGWGVVLDDLVAGIYALLLMQLVTRAVIVPWAGGV